MAALGYAIVNEAGELFAGYKHPGTRKTGYPVWVKALDNTNFDGGAASIWPDLKSAADVARSIYIRDGVHCSAKAIGLLHD